MTDTFMRFGLTLMVNHACNLRCDYCYTGAKFSSAMSGKIAIASIDRAFASIKSGGHLDMSFFGGEPLLESVRILEWMAHSRQLACATNKRVRFNLTTNGTIINNEAWRVMMADDLDLAVSFDGTPEIHDRHRRDVKGRGSAGLTEQTLRQLMDKGKRVRVNMVIRPDMLEQLPAGLLHLHNLGVRHVDLSLDVWTKWTIGDGQRLENAIDRAAQLWRGWLPEFGLNWFDAKVGELAALPETHADTRCGFGVGEIAVAPSGRLYPCERLIGEDHPNHPLRLPGNAMEGQDFLSFTVAPMEKNATCSSCLLNSACDTACRCSNFIRTGNVDRPDGLLCILNKATARLVSEVLDQEKEIRATKKNPQPEVCYG